MSRTGCRVEAARVLVVDDRTSSRRQIGRELKRRGHEIIEACDGDEAIAQFERHAPSAVVTDMRMPRADGFDLLEAIRARSDIPVYCVTAFPEWDSAQLAVKRGATYYYRWPQDFDRLIDDVDNELATRADDRASEAALPFRSLAEIRDAARSETALERKHLVEDALRLAGGNVNQAAEILRVSRRTLYNWMDRYDVKRN